MKNNFIIDVHCHLQDEKYENMDMNKIIEDAKKNKVKYIIISGYDADSNHKALNLAERYDNVYATVGYHPSEAEENNDYKELEKLLNHPKVVALGEMGLDYYYGKDKEKQKESFIKQLQIANKYNKPVVIHSRDSIEDTYEILKKHKNKNIKGLLHCYASNYEMAKKFMEINMMFSISGVVTFKNNMKTKEFVKICPIDYLMAETDAPYLTPEPNRGKINFPGNTFYTVKMISEIKEMNLEDVMNITSQNAISFFDLKI